MLDVGRRKVRKLHKKCTNIHKIIDKVKQYLHDLFNVHLYLLVHKINLIGF